MIKRITESEIYKYLDSKEKKIMFIWGPRRSGKTTILQTIEKKLKSNIYNFDFISEREKFSTDRKILDNIIQDNKVLLIDEVQNFPESTKILKLLHDEYNIKIIATGSSELRQKSLEFDSLAGRFIEKYCLPLSLDEIKKYQKVKSSEKSHFNKHELKRSIIWGDYPEVYLKTKEDERIYILDNILNTYVLKDVVSIYNLKDTKLAKDILLKISLQIGSEVSLREIANSLQANVVTVSNYIEIFIRNYIIIQLPSFKTNLRRAVSENKKYYFFDMGIRNALIKDFRSPNLRQDYGCIFENYIIKEIVKHKLNNNKLFNMYFYREYSGKEVDLIIESYKKEYKTYEIKLNKTQSISKFPISNDFYTINQGNYTDIIARI